MYVFIYLSKGSYTQREQARQKENVGEQGVEKERDRERQTDNNLTVY